MSANTFCIAGNYILRKFHSIKKSVSNSFFQINKSFSTTEEIMVRTYPLKMQVFIVTEDNQPYSGLLF